MGKILSGIIDHLTGPQGCYHFQVPGAVDPGYLRSEVYGKLECLCADASGSAVNEYLLSAPDITFSKHTQRSQRPDRKNGGLVEHIKKGYGDQNHNQGHHQYCLRFINVFKEMGEHQYQKYENDPAQQTAYNTKPKQRLSIAFINFPSY